MLRYVSLFTLKNHSKWRANKNEHGEGIMLIRTFVLKVINNERKNLTHHETTDRIAEQIESRSSHHSKYKSIKICHKFT